MPYQRVVISDQERASWTVGVSASTISDWIPARCINVRIGNIHGRVSIIIVLETSGDDPKEVLRFFSAKKGNGKAKDYIVPHDGALAKLIRITLGVHPRKRYCKAQQLARHLIGHNFLIQPELSQTEGSAYWKTKTIKPEIMMSSEEWSATGTLYGKQSSSVIMSGDKPDKKGRRSGDKKEMRKSGISHSYLGSGAIPIAHQPITNNTATHTLPISDNGDIDNEQLTQLDPFSTTVKLLSPTNRVFAHHRRPDETEEQYHERIIDESISSW